jgi:hypothetical protein
MLDLELEVAETSSAYLLDERELFADFEKPLIPLVFFVRYDNLGCGLPFEESGNALANEVVRN